MLTAGRKAEQSPPPSFSSTEDHNPLLWGETLKSSAEGEAP